MRPVLGALIGFALASPAFVFAFASAAFASPAVTLTGDATVDVTGDLAPHGVTKPVTLQVRDNGGWEDMPMDVGARVGFSASTAFNRSDFGIGYGIPAPGTTMGVSDRVGVILETEFTKPRP